MRWTLDITRKNRIILHSFLESLTLQQLNEIPEGFNNNIFWNIAHTVVTQQLLVYNLSGLPMNVSPQLVDLYKKGTRPTEDVGQHLVDELKDLLFSTLDQTMEDYEAGKFKNYNEYTVTTQSTLTNVEEAMEFNNFHEGLHLGSILALKRNIK